MLYKIATVLLFVSMSHSFPGSSRVEEVPYEVIEQEGSYEVRKYPDLVWVCSSVKGHDTSDDFLKDWREKYDSPLEAMADRRKNRGYTPMRQLFKKLYYYISGGNRQFKNIPMTAPVLSKHTLDKPNSVLEDVEKCFWLGVAEDRADFPSPLHSDVYIKETPEFVAHVWKFGGYALSQDDWDMQYDLLKDALALKGVAFDGITHYTAGYNSPWARKNRRNEVWLIEN